MIMDIEDLIKAYELLVYGIDTEATHNNEDRAYGGVIRAGKGMLVESMAKAMVSIAWADINGNMDRLSLEKKAVPIPMKPEYIGRIKCKEVREYIKNNISSMYYYLRTDVHVYIDGKFKLAVECKAYTENAMLKRILVDFTLLNQVHPELHFVLLQLESQLGGDYSSCREIRTGSPSTNTLLSYFDIDLNIITLLEGERKVDKPIHKPDYYKALQRSSIETAVSVFKKILA